MASLFDRILNRKPKLDQPRSDSGRAHYGGFLDEDELNNELRGRSGLQVYDRMYRSDHDIRRNVAMAANPLVGATWSTEPFGGDEATDEDREIADDVAWALGLGEYAANTPNRTPWAAHLAEFLPVVIRSGFTPGELEWCVAERDGRKLITLRRIGMRLPRTIHRWITNPGDLATNTTGAGSAYPRSASGDELLAVEHYRASIGDYVLLPREDLLYYRLGVEGDNWEGISLLRPVYKAWYIKDRIERLDAQGIEREAVGLPVVYPPKGGAQGAGVLDDLEAKLALLRQGNLAYLVMPGPSAEHDVETGWHFEIMGLGGEGGGGKRDAQPSLQYWRDAISTGFIQEFMRLGQGGTGSKGAMSTAEVQDDPFAAAVTAMAAPLIAEVTQLVIRRFVTLNYGADKPLPVLTMNLSEGDLAELVTYVGTLVGAGALYPDDVLEDFLRQRGKLPPADKAARDERKAQEEEARQAEIEGQKAGPAVGQDGHHEATTETRKPDGTRTVKREKTKTTARALDDAPHSARDAGALQINTPMVGDRKCGHCGHHHAGDDCDDCPECTKTLAAEPRAWERVMPLEQLAAHMDSTAAAIAQITKPHLAAIAAEAAQDSIAGRAGPQEPPSALVDALTTVLTQARAFGYASVEGELAAQRARTRVLEIDVDLVRVLAGDLPKGPIAKRAWLAAKAIVTTITAAVQGRHLDGITDPGQLAAAGETAGDQAAAFQGRGSSAGAVNHGRDDAAQDYAHLIKGSRYTSILDRNRCQTCALADDGVLRTLDDPLRLINRPPNPGCKSILSGVNRCRCLEFYELNDEAPAYLDTSGRADPFVLFDPDQPRDKQGRFARLPHPGALTHVSELGGSTGARLMRDQAGGHYVVKRGSHRRHLLEEDAADRIYRAAGARVPDSQIHPTPKGPVKVARFLPGGRTLHELDAQERGQAHTELRAHFALDALLANWDVIGLGRDNAMTSDGKTYRIDNGGALRYRAQGQPKAKVSAWPSELWTMREHGPGRDVFGGMPWEEIIGQARGLLEQREQLLAAAPGGGQRAFLNTRLAGLREIVDLHDQGWTEHALRVRAGAAPAEHLLDDVHAFTIALDELEPALELDATDEDIYTLAKDWKAADHPRDGDGRFVVKIGDIPLSVIAAVAGAVTGDKASPAPSRAVEKALKHKKTTTHTATKNGKAFTVTQHDVAAHPEGLDDLQKAVDHALATKAYSKAANSSAAKQGLERAAKKLALARQAAAELGVTTPPPGKIGQKGPSLPELKPADPTAPPDPRDTAPANAGPKLKTPDLEGALKQAGAKVTKPKKTSKIVNGDGAVTAAHLPEGAKVQKAKGGNILTITGEANASGSYLKTTKTNGKPGPWLHKGAIPYSYELPPGGKITEPAAPAPKATPESLAAKLATDGKPPTGSFQALPKGTVFQDLEGNLAVLDPDTPAYSGYVTGHVISGPKKGGKVEVPGGKAPAKILLPTAAEGAMDLIAPGSAGAAPKAPGTPATSAPKATGPKMYGGVKPHHDKFDGVPTDEHGEQLWKAWQADTKAKLTGPEISAISSYTDGGYGQINSQLRQSTGVGNVSIAQQVARLDSALAKAELSKQPTVVSRKVSNVSAWSSSAKPGTVIQDNGYLSTSTNGGTWGGDVHLKILLPAGTRGLWVNTTGGSSHSNEKEIILPRGSQFIVHERVETGGAVVLYVELIV